jgi:hypothetical protein
LPLTTADDDVEDTDDSAAETEGEEREALLVTGADNLAEVTAAAVLLADDARTEVEGVVDTGVLTTAEDGLLLGATVVDEAVEEGATVDDAGTTVAGAVATEGFVERTVAGAGDWPIAPGADARDDGKVAGTETADRADVTAVVLTG